jgi:hypothetical protein
MYITSRDIVAALEEQANSKDDVITPPHEDLQGWGVIHATDENGCSRPLLLMRVLPAPTLSKSYSNVRDDDRAMEDIILTEVYKLTPRRIKWLQFKAKARNVFLRIFKQKKKIRPIKPPKTTAGWLGDMMNKTD